MRFILHMLLWLPLLSAGMLLMVLACSLLWLGLHGVMGWLLDLSTTWGPPRAWTVWQGFHPLAIWAHGLQTSRPVLLAFHGSSDVLVRVCLGMAGVSTVCGWTVMALHLAVRWLAVGTIGLVSGCRVVFEHDRTLHPKSVAAVLDLLVLGSFVGHGMPLFLTAVPGDNPLITPLARSTGVLVLALLVHTLSWFVWWSVDASIEPRSIRED
jgi:hypothetical protein